MSDDAPKTRKARIRALGVGPEFLMDKAVDFVLIFVGLYAATALQRCQDEAREHQEYLSLLKDFKAELQANREQEASIVKDLGEIVVGMDPPEVGPMRKTFEEFFHELEEDEKVVACLHKEFATDKGLSAHPEDKEACHALYKGFSKHHEDIQSFSFKPVVLTPFYRYEVYDLYLANGVRIFENKELAVKIGEIYNNARIIEKQVANIERTYNDSFMKQVGRTAATDIELAEIIHDEEEEGHLSATDLITLTHISEAIKDEHYAAKEVESILELEVERMKNTVLTMRAEIEAVQKAIDEEVAAKSRGG